MFFVPGFIPVRIICIYFRGGYINKYSIPSIYHINNFHALAILKSIIFPPFVVLLHLIWSSIVSFLYYCKLIQYNALHTLHYSIWALYASEVLCLWSSGGMTPLCPRIIPISTWIMVSESQTNIIFFLFDFNSAMAALGWAVFLVDDFTHANAFLCSALWQVGF